MWLTAQQVTEQRFTPVRIKEGYDMGEVDRFLDQVASTLRHLENGRLDAPGLLRPDEVVAQRFTPVRLREGYAISEVDQFLDQVTATLQRYVGDAGSQPVAAAAQGAPGQEAPAARTCPVDGSRLVAHQRQDVEADLCPSCDGVWLDRGELDTIIAHALALTLTNRDDTTAAPNTHEKPGGWFSTLFKG